MHKITLSDWLRKLDIFGENQGKVPFDLEITLEHLKHLLPNQGPIKDFIHHNPLHGLQSLPFHEGLTLAASLFGSKGYLGLDFYERQFSTGAITEAHLDFVLNQSFSDSETRNEFKTQLMSFKGNKEIRFPNVSEWGLRHLWLEKHALELPSLIAPTLFKLLSSYLDQGISFWPFPSRKDSLWLSIRELNQKSIFPLFHFKKEKLKVALEQDPETAIQTALAKLVGDPNFFSRYLLETILCYPGWSGMVCALETNPSLLRKPCSISLKEFLALTLTLESLTLEKHFKAHTPTLEILPFSNKVPDQLNYSHQKLSQLWQEAFEWSFYEQVLKSVQSNSQRPKADFATELPWAQAIFCIDDRECSVRRHLELKDPGIETFGTAGFFGVDFWFLAHDEVFPLQQSPVTITPKHLVRSIPKHTKRKKKKDNIFDTVLGGLFKDLFLVPFLSISALAGLFKSIFFRSNRMATSSSLTQFESQVVLEFKSSENESKDSRFQHGFTVDEMAERVARTLKGMGLTKNFAECIYVVAHGASSANNPHFAAYDCGACSGKSGAPNARAFAWMANHLPVRKKLKEMGIVIPDETLFYGMLHDTTQDKAIFFEEDLENSVFPESHRKFQALFTETLKINSKERARRLELVPCNLSLDEVAEAMADRAHSIFEPRPELNHATNAATIVGRRELSRGLFLDRRSFLQSYDPFSDPSGDILFGLLSAVIPVCGGINLEYFFSRMDNERYGAGTKLSHNVVGLLGVSNGVNNDLIPGLPLQMIEAHDPLRLLIVIDQEPDIIQITLKRSPFLYEWVNHHWIQLAAISPSTQEVSLWANEGWLKIDMQHMKPPPGLSLDVMNMGKLRNNLPISILTSSNLIGSQL